MYKITDNYKIHKDNTIDQINKDTYNFASKLHTNDRLGKLFFWTSPGSNTPQDANCTATCPLSRKLFKLDEPDMQDTAGEAEMNS